MTTEHDPGKEQQDAAFRMTALKEGAGAYVLRNPSTPDGERRLEGPDLWTVAGVEDDIVTVVNAAGDTKKSPVDGFLAFQKHHIELANAESAPEASIDMVPRSELLASLEAKESPVSEEVREEIGEVAFEALGVARPASKLEERLGPVPATPESDSDRVEAPSEAEELKERIHKILEYAGQTKENMKSQALQLQYQLDDVVRQAQDGFRSDEDAHRAVGAYLSALDSLHGNAQYMLSELQSLKYRSEQAGMDDFTEADGPNKVVTEFVDAAQKLDVFMNNKQVLHSLRQFMNPYDQRDIKPTADELIQYASQGMFEDLAREQQMLQQELANW